MDNSTPVLVLQSGHHGGLGILRSLGRLGVPVYCAGSSRWEPSGNSRYCRKWFGLSIDTKTSTESVMELGRIAGQIGGNPVLIPTSDRQAVWVADNQSALRTMFRFPLQDVGLVNSLCDKSRMQALARQHSIPIAETLLPRSRQDVLHYIETATFPVMVKATDAERLRIRVGGTKFLVRHPDDLLDLYSRAVECGEANLFFQEYIPGEDWMFNGYFDQSSECLFGITGRKIRRFPPRTGVTSLGMCAHNDTVEKMTTDFMKGIRYKGILDIGYRYDRRDGLYKVLDVNPRIGCTFRLFTSVDGLDVARALYLSLTKQPVPRTQSVEGRRWVVEDFDAFSSLSAWIGGTLPLKEWVGSLKGVDEFACFASDDPLPCILMGASDCGQFYRWVRTQIDIRKNRPPALFEFEEVQSPSK